MITKSSGQLVATNVRTKVAVKSIAYNAVVTVNRQTYSSLSSHTFSTIHPTSHIQPYYRLSNE